MESLYILTLYQNWENLIVDLVLVCIALELAVQQLISCIKMVITKFFTISNAIHQRIKSFRQFYLVFHFLIPLNFANQLPFKLPPCRFFGCKSVLSLSSLFLISSSTPLSVFLQGLDRRGCALVHAPSSTYRPWFNTLQRRE